MTLTKLEVAARQLDVAIRLFLAGDHLSSLTLAGAAEEILGKLCEREGKPVAMEAIIAFHWGDTDQALTDKERRKHLLEVRIPVTHEHPFQQDLIRNSDLS